MRKFLNIIPKFTKKNYICFSSPIGKREEEEEEEFHVSLVKRRRIKKMMMKL